MTTDAIIFKFQEQTLLRNSVANSLNGDVG